MHSQKAPWGAACSHPDRPSEDAWWIDRALGVGIVADGMSGREGAGRAAHRSTEHLHAISHLLPAEGKRLGWARKLMEYLRNDLLEYREQEGIPEADAGAALWVRDSDQIEVAWCGDVRAYLWKRDKLVRLTLDHIQILEDLPQDQQEEILGHLDRAQLPEELDESMRAYWYHKGDTYSGVARGPVGVARSLFEPQEKVMLCSDGVHHNLSQYEIAQAFIEEDDPSQILLERSLHRSGSSHPRSKQDDITLIVIPHS